jgi:hypothetical protein
MICFLRTIRMSSCRVCTERKEPLAENTEGSEAQGSPGGTKAVLTVGGRSCGWFFK